ncbi:MAG: hypothetical protein JXB60_05845, partial [Candidatus Cloacimonetes bacterium]|nr:hypothetical protein [Candidatus Cloacimonadota bacterium]
PIRDEMGNLIPANISGDDLLNIRSKLEKKNDFFYFDYFVTDTTIVARTNKYFGKDGAEVFYYLPSGPWGVGKDNVSQNIIDPNWLP